MNVDLSTALQAVIENEEVDHFTAIDVVSDLLAQLIVANAPDLPRARKGVHLLAGAMLQAVEENWPNKPEQVARLN